MILKPEDFKGTFDVGVTETTTWRTDTIQAWIDEYEPEYCTALLGGILYAEIQTSPDDESGYTEDRTALIDKLKPLVLRYVYVRYIEDQRYAVAGGAVAVPLTSNGNTLSPFDVHRVRWNEMSGATRELIMWLEKNTEKYPSWDFDCGKTHRLNLLRNMSILGIFA
jgi:hypothetical protein